MTSWARLNGRCRPNEGELFLLRYGDKVTTQRFEAKAVAPYYQFWAGTEALWWMPLDPLPLLRDGQP